MTPAELSDGELSALVAERVAKKLECDQWKPFNSQSMIKGDCGHADCIPRGMKINYATSADAVLPLLEKGLMAVSIYWRDGEWQVYMADTPTSATCLMGKATTLPRAACLALLAAHQEGGT